MSWPNAATQARASGKSQAQRAAVLFAATQARASGKDQAAVNAIVRETIQQIKRSGSIEHEPAPERQEEGK